MTAHIAPKSNAGWKVTFAGTGINLALGILYSWSVFAKFLRDDMGWTAFSSQLPYMIACGVFAIFMVPGGRVQDKIGPRAVIMTAAVFAGLGLIGSSFFMTVAGLSVFFGIFFGTAMGLGYSSATPPAIKWFGPEKRGLVTGLVVSGFGLASVYAAPLADYLIRSFGMPDAFLYLGFSFFVIIILLAQLMKNPPAGYTPLLSAAAATKQKSSKRVQAPVSYEWIQTIKTPHFYLLWLMFCFTSLAGLMVIGQLSSIAREQSGVALGFYLVAILAVFNAGGRILGGLMYDRLGRTLTMVLIFGVQAVNFLFFNLYTDLGTMLAGTIVAGFCYGACLSIFPTTTADMFGVKNLGVNYGLVFTAWGAGGVFGGLIGGLVRDATGTYFYAYLISAILCFISVALAVLIHTLKLPGAAKSHPVPSGKQR